MSFSPVDISPYNHIRIQVSKDQVKWVNFSYYENVNLINLLIVAEAARNLINYQDGDLNAFSPGLISSLKRAVRHLDGEDEE